MNHRSKTHHTLEIKTDRRLLYVPILGGIYKSARRLAHQGRLIEAIDEAEEIRKEECGDMIGVSFRVVTTTRAVTSKEPFEDAEF